MNDAPRHPQSLATVPVYALPSAQDSINLVDLWRVLAAKRVLIATVTGVVVLLAIGYALTAGPVYRAEAFLLMPLQHDVEIRTSDGASLRGMNIEGVTEMPAPAAVYDDFIKNLQSRRIRRELFDSRKLDSHYSQNLESGSKHEAFTKFNDALAVYLTQQEGDRRFLRVSLDFSDPELAAELLNEFVALANLRTIDDLLSSVRSDIRTRITYLRDLIERERGLAIALVADRIEQLDEAVSIASSLGIVEPVSPEIVLAPAIQSEIGQQMMQNLPLYQRGVKSLSAEKAVLEKRKNVDAFVDGLREKQSRLEFLQSIEIDPSNLRAAITDQSAIAPESRIKPRRALLASGGAVVGLALGIFLALLATLVDRLRAELRADEGLPP